MAKLYVEQAVPIDHITGEEGATGSADVIHKIPELRRLNVYDLKMGRHKVMASKVVVPATVDIITGEPVPPVVKPNLQMAMYALGALRKFCEPGEIDTVTMTIIQPLLDHISEYTCSVDELLEVEAWLRKRAIKVHTDPEYSPSEEACFYCRANGDCEAQRRMVVENALIGFEDVSEAEPAPVRDLTLGDSYALLPLVRRWADMVELKVRDALNNGQVVRRSDGLQYVLVEGRGAARTWVDETPVVETLTLVLSDGEVWKRSLASPAEIEKMTKRKRAKKGEPPTSPRLPAPYWEMLQQYITQGQTAPAIALETDERPRAAASTDGFTEVQDPEAEI